MRIFDIIESIAERVSTALDTQDKNGQIRQLREEKEKLRFERDYAIDLNNKKDDYVKSLGGKLLQEGNPEGGKLLADWKKYKKKKN